MCHRSNDLVRYRGCEFYTVIESNRGLVTGSPNLTNHQEQGALFSDIALHCHCITDNP